MKKLFAMTLVLLFAVSASGFVMAADAPGGKHHKLTHKAQHKGASKPGKSTIKGN